MVEIFVPRPADPLPEGTDAYGITWVTVQHPGLGVEHRIPVDALDGFRESGWDLIEPETESSNDQPAAVDNDDTSKE